MFNFDLDRVKDVIEGEELGGGDLTIFIGCHKCGASFELNKEGVVMAIASNASFIQYLKWIQKSKCPVCNKDETEKPQVDQE